MRISLITLVGMRWLLLMQPNSLLLLSTLLLPIVLQKFKLLAASSFPNVRSRHISPSYYVAAIERLMLSHWNAIDGDEIDYQNPSLMNGDVQVKQPKLLTCTLKEYQLKGLNWLANLYEQGINGILADEMVIVHLRVP